jgi:hypothetical protein
MLRSIAIVLFAGACWSGDAPPPATTTTTAKEPVMPRSTKPMTVKPAMFGDVTIEDGAIHLMDGGIHGVQGHTIVVPPDGTRVTWERRVDGMQPSGKAGNGTIDLMRDELGRVRAWADAAWKLAPMGRKSFADPADGVPRWVWAIVVRRGDEIRVLDGGGMSPPDDAPAETKSALAWLIERVDAAAR